ncbi:MULTISPECIES: tripartite tricarboxylate transporter TctB family protein [Nocardiopsidaceae]|uniref:Tripartite tricarboxylate transporter TctB family protein n=1 Tax=Streptomonospora nanhaiensis TaxID=1323731 RepID=A0ABY6YHS7_9ACTN|nr:tripartite tricarboxylate transporter TctB family protein [Streptomonospora nanhaiensis]WAE71817.1 tripartite tricarboxylate transporter TctB family protein [Streptomonospora nanhaiensis]
MSGPATGAPRGETAPARARPSVLATHAVLACLGGFFFLGSFSYPWTTVEDGTVGPGALPRVAGLALLLIGLAMLRREARTGTVLEGDGHVEEETERTDAEHRTVRRKLAVVSAALVATAVLIPFLGMLPTLAALTLFLTISVERLRWPVALTASLGVLVVCYLLFGVLLRVPLPLGVFDPALWGAV